MMGFRNTIERVLDNEPSEERDGSEAVNWRDLRLEMRALRAELRLLLILGIFANTLLAGLHLPAALMGSAVGAYLGRVVWQRRQ